MEEYVERESRGERGRKSRGQEQEESGREEGVMENAGRKGEKGRK